MAPRSTETKGYQLASNLSHWLHFRQVAGIGVSGVLEFAGASWILPLRTKLEKHKVGIYGQNDSTHWFHPGTDFAAETMTEELVKVTAR